MTDPVADAVAAVLAAQRAKGLSHYGVRLADANLTALELLDYAIEEAADKLDYLVAMKLRMEAEAQP